MAPPPRPNPTYYDGDLRQDLVAAATELIRERGAASVSLREVARIVGVSHAAPAHHFGDRTGLLVAVATAAFGAFADALEQALAQAPPEPLGRLAASGAAYTAYAADNLRLFEVMFTPAVTGSGDPALQAASARAIRVLRDGVGEAQAAGWAPGRSADDMVTTCWALAHGLAVLDAMGALPGGHAQAATLSTAALDAFWSPR